MSWKDKKYDVGFGKPPKSGRFKKGKSGNPKGRPKGTRNFATDLEEALSAKVTVVENGKKRKVSTQVATLRRLSEKAMIGDPRSMALLLAFAEQQANEKEARSSEQSLSASDQQIIDDYYDVIRLDKTPVPYDDGESSNDD